LPITQDTVQITATAAPVCGQTGAQNVALRQAAVETLRRGYDRFVIVGGQYSDNVRVVGHTPVVAHTTGTATATGHGGFVTAHGTSQTTFTGGQPIVGGSHNQGLLVKMFRADDPAGANAVSARDTLGPKWEEAVKSDAISCLPT